MTNSSDFPLSVVGHACSGATELRTRLVDAGLDTETIARILNVSPLAIVRATKTGATPRGLLVGLATLTTVVDRIHVRGIPISDLVVPTQQVEDVLADIAEESPIAARMVERLRDAMRPDELPAQLRFDAGIRAAA